MRRKITLAFLILAAFLLQTTVFQYFQIASVTPNLLLILTSAFGLMRGKKEGLMVGFFSGLMIDLFYGSLFGFYALLYMYIGYLNGFFCKVYYDDDIKVHIVLVAASDLVYSLLMYVLQFLLRVRLHFFDYLAHIILRAAGFPVQEPKKRCLVYKREMRGRASSYHPPCACHIVKIHKNLLRNE